ncbi:HIT family protein [Brackiella oedipodis]|uniref:HIT family protein n=1 Tax=Brackiella oedipodis TaxID=124225 RepID=UPI00048ADDA2|nr:HIT family protein [Brackiella oedipodis]
MTQDCTLCEEAPEGLIWENAQVQVLNALDQDYPAYTRVVWKAHQKEMTDLSPEEQQQLMQVVFTVERVQRDIFKPLKVNLAELGNYVPHLHWHIIPRFENDRHYPNPIWAMPQENNPIKTMELINQHNDLLEDYERALRAALDAL